MTVATKVTPDMSVNVAGRGQPVVVAEPAGWTALGRAVVAEALKTRRTLALAMTVLAPLVIAVVQFAMYLDRAQQAYTFKDGQDPWTMYCRNFLVWWALLMLPLFVTLETALLNGVDHEGRHWTLLHTLPVPRWAYYAAKAMAGLGLVGLSMAVAVVLMVAVAQPLRLLAPQLGLDAPFPWADVLIRMLRVYLTSWLMIGLHLWVSRRWDGFVLPLGVGIAATVAAVFVAERPTANFYPWTMPAVVGAQLAEAATLDMIVAIGCAGGLVMLLLGAWDSARRDVV